MKYLHLATAAAGWLLLASCGGTKNSPGSDLPLSPLNDTGITLCSSGPEGSAVRCPQPEYPGQDAEYGRDAQANLSKVGGGNAGFDFTKLDSRGIPLANQTMTWDQEGSEQVGSRWSCVMDNVTGLTWEVKHADLNSVQYFQHKYSWFNDDTRNGGSPGSLEGGQCVGLTQCNTKDYLAYINTELKLCGSAQWRLPTINELLSIVDHSKVAPPLDTFYFPNASTDAHWSSQTVAHQPDYAWYVYFTAGGNSPLAKFAGGHILLVNDSVSTH